MNKWTFETDAESDDFCEKIVAEMKSRFGISEQEAIARINAQWEGSQFVGCDLIYHETEEYWANTIYYGHDSYWWIEDDKRRVMQETPGAYSKTETPNKDISQPASPQQRKTPVGVLTPGEITYNKKWKLTRRSRAILTRLAQLGVNVFSSLNAANYVLMVPNDLFPSQYDEIERLMASLGKEVRASVDYIDSHPHGSKFRISPPEEPDQY